MSADVLVLGAGVAGLAAARALAAKGLRPLVLDARDRLGGRIDTHRVNGLAPIEGGAEFVHGRDPALARLLRGLRVAECRDAHWRAHDGKLVRADAAWGRAFEVVGALDLGLARDDEGRERSFGDLLRDPSFEARWDRRTRAMAAGYVSGFNAAELDRVSVRSLVEQERAAAKIEGDRIARVLDGYDRVVERLVHLRGRTLPFLLGTRVVALRWRPGHVAIEARTEAGALELVAPRAIVTLPLGVLQAGPGETGAVRFLPELPQEKRRAIHALAMGDVVKVVLRFREPFWARRRGALAPGKDLGFLHIEGAPFPTWWTPSPSGDPVLVAWAAAEHAQAVSGLPRHEIVERALESLRRGLGTGSRLMEDVFVGGLTFDWKRDPYARGAYTYEPVGVRGARRELARPIADTLFFAGEATETTGHAGTVHGALATGRRVAREVLDSVAERWGHARAV